MTNIHIRHLRHLDALYTSLLCNLLRLVYFFSLFIVVVSATVFHRGNIFMHIFFFVRRCFYQMRIK